MLEKILVDTSNDDSNPRSIKKRFRIPYKKCPPSISIALLTHSTDDSAESCNCHAHAKKKVLTHNNILMTSLEASVGTGDTSAEFYMEPGIHIEDEDDVNSPIVLPPVETNEQWMVHIDAKWEVRRLQIEANFVPTYHQPVTPTWLALSPMASLPNMDRRKDPPSIGECSAPPHNDLALQDHPPTKEAGKEGEQRVGTHPLYLDYICNTDEDTSIRSFLLLHFVHLLSCNSPNIHFIMFQPHQVSHSFSIVIKIVGTIVYHYISIEPSSPFARRES